MRRLQCPDAHCKGKRRRPRPCRGLKVVDDKTFTIKTSEPVSNLPVRLGYTAFAPLPDSFFADPKAYEKKPIGAGPFKMDSKSPTPSSCSSKFADYCGDPKPNVDKLTFRIYQDPARPTPMSWPTASTTRDIIPRTSSSATLYKDDLPDR